MNKKKIQILIGTGIALVVIIASVFFYQQSQRNKVLDSLSISFVENTTIEYGTKDFDVKTLLKDYSGKLGKLPKVDTNKIGKQELVFTLSKEGLTKEFKHKVEIKDTKAPVITLEKETVELTVGDDYDPKSNVKVADPVDGDIKDFTIKTDLDTSKAGSYKVTVQAKDKNGNESKKEFTISVKEKEKEPTNAGSTGNSNYTPPASSNNGGSKPVTPPSSNNNGGTTQTPQPKPEYCTHPEHQVIDNSGMVFNDYNSAWNWATEEQFNEGSKWYMHAFRVVEHQGRCGGKYATVKFTPVQV